MPNVATSRQKQDEELTTAEGGNGGTMSTVTKTEKVKFNWLHWLINSAPLLAVAITFAGLVITLLQMNADTNRQRADAANEKIREWQTVVVCKILQDKRDTALTFEEISSAYVTEATKTEKLDIPKSEIQDIELRRILMHLQTLGLVYLTIDGNYIAQLSMTEPRFDRYSVDAIAKYELLGLLSTETGKYTLDDIQKKLTEKIAIRPAEFSVVSNELIATGVIVIRDGKVWSAATAPPVANDKP